MIIDCTSCDGPIEVNNHGFVGYCSPKCRDRGAAERQRRRREAQAAKRQRDAAVRYLT